MHLSVETSLAGLEEGQGHSKGVGGWESRGRGRKKKIPPYCLHFSGHVILNETLTGELQISVREGSPSLYQTEPHQV